MLNLRINIAALVFLHVSVVSLATAQDFPPRYSQMVRIESDPPGAELYTGDSLIGTTPMKVHQDKLPGMTAWYPSRSAWNASMQELPETALSEVEGVVALTFNRLVLIHTIPDNASVYDGGEFLGKTPLRLPMGWVSDTLYVVKPGYEQQSVIISAENESPPTIVLEASASVQNINPVRRLNGTLNFPPTRVLLASAIGLGAGVAAVILKREADSWYTTYTQSGRTSDLDSSERYDLYSGAALAMLQLSLAYLIYELFITP